MNSRSKIILFYGGVAVASVAMVLFFHNLGRAVPEQPVSQVRDVGKETVESFFPIKEDLELVNQEGEEVKLSDIRGKVTVVTEFFAVCPHCAVRSGIELRELIERFGSNPDFRIVCISVDPETDGPVELKAYAEALDADPRNWWFATAGSKEQTHRYLEKVLGFMGIRERRDPVDIASNGRYSHDLGLMLVDRDFNVVGKWPLADARSAEGRAQDPGNYERLKTEMYERIEKELNEP